LSVQLYALGICGHSFFLFLLYSVLVSIEKMKIWSERGGGIVKFCKPGDPCFPTHAHHLQPTHAFNLYFSFLFFRVEILIVCKKIKINKKYTRFVLVNSNISAVNCGIKKKTSKSFAAL